MSVLNVPVTSTLTPRPKGAISIDSDSAHRSSALLLALYALTAPMPLVAA